MQFCNRARNKRAQTRQRRRKKGKTKEKKKGGGGGVPHQGVRCSRWTGGRRGTRGPPWRAARGGTWRSPASRGVHSPIWSIGPFIGPFIGPLVHWSIGPFIGPFIGPLIGPLTPTVISRRRRRIHWNRHCFKGALSPPPTCDSTGESTRVRFYIAVERLILFILFLFLFLKSITDSTLPPQRRGIPWGRP